MVTEAEKHSAIDQFVAITGVDPAKDATGVRLLLDRHGYRVEEALSAYFDAGTLPQVGEDAERTRQAEEDAAFAAQLAAEDGLAADQSAQFERFHQAAEAALRPQDLEPVDVDVDFFEVGLMARRCCRPFRAPRPIGPPSPPQTPMLPPYVPEPTEPPYVPEPRVVPQPMVVPQPIAEPPADLGAPEERTPVPLQGMSISVRAFCMAAQVEVKQFYVNDRDHAVEAQFRFRQANCSVYALSVCIDGKLSHARMLPKQQAAAKYAQAMRDGQAAFTLERITDADAFVLNVGNLKAGSECVITFEYVTDLELRDGYTALELPITRTRIGEGGPRVPRSDKGDSDAATPIAGEGLLLDVFLAAPSPIEKVVADSSHEIVVEKLEDGAVKVSFADSVAAAKLAQSLVLLVETTEKNKPLCMIEKFAAAKVDEDRSLASGKQEAVEDPSFARSSLVADVPEAERTAMMISFVPDFDEASDQLLASDDESLSEIIFVIDQSGSMAGSRIKQARSALQLFLRSLPEGTKFNIVSFGDHHRKLFPTSVTYDETTFATATQYVADMDANFGGTNILSPLREVLATPPSKDFPRQVFLITDGDVNNTAEVIDVVKTSVGDCRVFTLGIGADACRRLVTGLARAGNGMSEFVQSGERLERKVLNQLKIALRPVLKNIKLDFGLFQCPTYSPNPLPPIFDGQRLIVYAFLDNSYSTLGTITLTAQTGKGTMLKFPCEVSLYDQLEGNLLHRLAARSLIRDLENGELDAAAKASITRLGQTYGIVSSETTLFVAHNWDTRSSTLDMEKIDSEEAAQRDLQAHSTERAHFKHDARLAWIAEQQVPEPAASAALPQAAFSSEPEPTSLEDAFAREEMCKSNSAAARKRAQAAPRHRLSSSPQAGLRAKVAEIFNMFDEVNDDCDSSASSEECAAEQEQYCSAPSSAPFSETTTSSSFAPFGSNTAADPYASGSSFGAGTFSFCGEAAAAPPPTFFSARSALASAGAPAPSEGRRALKRSGCLDSTLPATTQICMYQGASGLWDADGLVGILDGLLDLPPSALDILVATVIDELSGLDQSVLRSVCASALAIAALEYKYSVDKDQWELLVQKAMRRITATLKPLNSACTAATLVSKATDLIHPKEVKEPEVEFA